MQSSKHMSLIKQYLYNLREYSNPGPTSPDSMQVRQSRRDAYQEVDVCCSDGVRNKERNEEIS